MKKMRLKKGKRIIKNLKFNKKLRKTITLLLMKMEIAIKTRVKRKKVEEQTSF